MKHAAPPPEMPIAPDRRKGRGALSNDAGRFEGLSRMPFEDGWTPEEELRIRTEVRIEKPHSLITYNRSPDLPFDRSINLYRGCEHGCIYCFARPTHAYLGLSPGLDFETQLVARPAAPEVLEKELRAKSYKAAPLALGTNTDPYQPIERDLKIARNCLKVLADFKHPLAIVTKGTLVERDIDILQQLAQQGLVRVGVSLTTLDKDLSRRMEPRVPLPQRRLQMIERLARAGIPVRLMASPMIPALSDPELEAILKAGQAAGATSASWIMLRLPREVSPLFQQWLEDHYPDRAGRVMARLREMHGGQTYSAQWGKRMRGEGHYAQIIAHRFKLATKRLGLDEKQPALRTDLFCPPTRKGDQLALSL